MSEVKLGEICHITDGAHSKVERQYHGPLYLTSKNIKRGNLDLNNVDYISHENFDKLFPINSKAGRRPKKGDILIGIIGTFGNAYIYKESDDFGMSSSVGLIRPNPSKANSEFLYYLITSQRFEAIINSFKSGSVQGYTNIPTLKQIPLNLPPLPEQKAIAHILGTLDDKIELNRQMNQTLETMAQALFKSWFVDFDPVMDNALAMGNEIPDELQAMAEKRRSVIASDEGAKQSHPIVIANREERSGKQSHRLINTNPELAALFPSSFEYNETLGKWIPEGWEVKKINTLCQNIQNGGTPRRDNEEYWLDGKIPWLTSGEVRQNIIYNTNNFITATGLKQSSSKWVQKFSTVIAMYGATAGQVAITSFDLTTNQAVCSLIPKKGFEFFNYLNLSNQVSYFENQARGSAQQNISKGIIELLKVVVPSENIQCHFHKEMVANFEKHISNLKQSETFTQLRDTLLPVLISGKVRVREEIFKNKYL